MDKEKATTEQAQRIRAAIAEVVGFEVAEIEDGDRFITDYNIAYTERKALLERLNGEFGKDLDFNAFCALEDVASVISAFAA